MPADSVIDWLQEYRRDKLVTGVNAKLSSPVAAGELQARRVLVVPREYVEVLSRLDLAFCLLHRFHASPSDFINRAVRSEIARQHRAARPRKSKYSALAIAQFAADRGYADLPDGKKKVVQQDALSRFGCQIGTFYDAIRKHPPASLVSKK
jgi:hypothetical protein